MQYNYCYIEVENKIWISNSDYVKCIDKFQRDIIGWSVDDV